MEVKIVNKSTNESPKYSREGDAGMDLRANIEGDISFTQIDSFGWAVVPTGIYVEIPKGYYGQIASRSGLAFKEKIEAFNGVIDSNYRGELKVLLKNLSPIRKTIEHGQRIAQLLIKPIATAETVEVESLEESNRGEQGFGSSGKH